jgi:hypothetical protein
MFNERVWVVLRNGSASELKMLLKKQYVSNDCLLV